MALVVSTLRSDGVGAEPPMFRVAGRAEPAVRAIAVTRAEVVRPAPNWPHNSSVQWMVMLPPLRATGVEPVVKTTVPEGFLITTLIVSPFFPPEAPLSTTDTWKV